MFYDLISNDFHADPYPWWVWNKETKFEGWFFSASFLDLGSLFSHQVAY